MNKLTTISCWDARKMKRSEIDEWTVTVPRQGQSLVQMTNWFFFMNYALWVIVQMTNWFFFMNYALWVLVLNRGNPQGMEENELVSAPCRCFCTNTKKDLLQFVCWLKISVCKTTKKSMLLTNWKKKKKNPMHIEVKPNMPMTFSRRSISKTMLSFKRDGNVITISAVHSSKMWTGMTMTLVEEVHAVRQDPTVSST